MWGTVNRVKGEQRGVKLQSVWLQKRLYYSQNLTLSSEARQLFSLFQLWLHMTSQHLSILVGTPEQVILANGKKLCYVTVHNLSLLSV